MFAVGDRVIVRDDTLNSPMLAKEKAAFIACDWHGEIVNVQEWTFSRNGFEVRCGLETAWFDREELTLANTDAAAP